jgi:PhnB protein
MNHEALRDAAAWVRCCAPQDRSSGDHIMPGNVSPIPPGRPQLTPYLIVKNGAGAIEFYQKAFGARELSRFDDHGRIGHAELEIGDSRIMLSDEYPDMGILSPLSLGGSAVNLHLYVENVDAVARQAITAGATVVRPVENQFCGDRGGKLQDPFGHIWWLASHIEDVSMEEGHKRAEALGAS